MCTLRRPLAVSFLQLRHMDYMLVFTVEIQMVLPIGYTSLVKACLAENSQGGSTTTVAMGKTTKTEMVVAGTLTNSKAKAVVPIEEPPPQMP